MSIDLSQFVEEYIESGRYHPLSADTATDESVLMTVVTETFNRQSPDYAPSLLTDLVFSCTVNLAISLKVKQSALSILESFFDWCAVTGKYPPALGLAKECARTASGWTHRFRDDGSIKGETTVNKGVEIGRNDPCICGSGKKFKKCCMGLI